MSAITPSTDPRAGVDVASDQAAEGSTAARSNRRTGQTELPRVARLLGLRPLVDAVAGIRASIHAKLFAGFLLSVLLLLGMGGLSLVVTDRMEARVRNLDRLQQRVDLARRMEYLVTAQSHYRTMALLTRDPAQNAQVANAKQNFVTALNAVEELSDTSDENWFERVREANDRYAVAGQQVLALYQEGSYDEALQLHLAQEHPISHELETAMRDLQQRSIADMIAARTSFYSDSDLLRKIVAGASAISLPLALLTGFVLSWSVIRPVRLIDHALARISHGHYGEQVRVANHDEFGTLSANLNSTSARLAGVYQQMEALNDNLTERNRDLGVELLQRRRAEEELAVARDQALDASRSKSAFLANMSHELRTPLNAIIGYSEILIGELGDTDQPELAADADRIRVSGKHLLTLINDILDLSKIEAGRLDIVEEQFGVADLVHEVDVLVRPLMAKNDNQFVVDCPSDLGVMDSDITRLRQALLNLLSNAAKFTDHGTVTLSVRRERRTGADRVTFTVKDTGIGLTPEQSGRLFESFNQADSSISRKYGGTGLGLAITRRLCRMMGGDVTVSSEKGAGSSFVIDLPVAVPRATSGDGDIGADMSVAPAMAVAAPVRAKPESPMPAPSSPAQPPESVPEAPPAVLVPQPVEHAPLPAVATAHPEPQPAPDVTVPAPALLKDEPSPEPTEPIVVSIVPVPVQDNAPASFPDEAEPDHTEEDVPAPVLVIADTPDKRDAVRELLSYDGIPVIPATGAAGFALASALRPSRIVLDALDRNGSGWRMLAQLKGSEDVAGIPITLVTAGQDGPVLVDGIDALSLEPHALATAIARGEAYGGTVEIFAGDPTITAELRGALAATGWSLGRGEEGTTLVLVDPLTAPVGLPGLRARYPHALLVLLLPAAIGDDAVAGLVAFAQGDVQQSSPPLAPAPVQTPTPATNGVDASRRVLLVEDNEMNRDMLSRRLRTRGYDVIMAEDGEQGLEMARTGAPAIILMDLKMPGIDGFQATRRLKASPVTCRIPVIALTAHSMPGDRDEALAAGCDDYDSKPVDLPRLLGKMDVLLGSSPPRGRQRALG